MKTVSMILFFIFCGPVYSYYEVDFNSVKSSSLKKIANCISTSTQRSRSYYVSDLFLRNENNQPINIELIFKNHVSEYREYEFTAISNEDQIPSSFRDTTCSILNLTIQNKVLIYSTYDYSLPYIDYLIFVDKQFDEVYISEIGDD